MDTIWQCTVPNSIIKHIGPSTSLAVAAGTSINSTAAATVKEIVTSYHSEGKRGTGGEFSTTRIFFPID